MRIREAGVGDAVPARQIVERAYAPYVKRMGQRPAPMDVDFRHRIAAGDCYVADDGGVVGLMTLAVGRDEVLVQNLAVLPVRQNEGIGRSLLRFAEQVARDRGRSHLRLYTNVAMTENIALYGRLGWTEVERRHEDGFDRVFFEKTLSGGSGTPGSG